ncbi:uncharacterized protein C3orf38 homolog isoform X2 [Periplaneta americana]|uniref:uncharacterized protein C3orf38 homolog isoform X2 n=1 Tax=Periplaneta americana TaxID=6978 RepID=UPI0037E95D88
MIYITEAIDAIILHSATPESLLSRKKLSKDILFKYLNKKKVPILPSADKKSMIDSILQMWGCASNNNQLLKSPVHDQDSAVVGMKPANTTPDVGEIDEMARQFTNWFYSMLNQHEVTSQETRLGIEHFWQDCNMCLVIQSEIESIKHEVQNNASDVVQLLCSTKIEHNLHFNPNMSSEGVKGKTDAHGLVMIIVCGTLHQQDRCVGVFEQLFGLIRDPSACNNWKIKYTNVILKSKSLVTCLPTLAEGSFLKSITAPPNPIQS